jgi:hypothetical protein
MSKKRSRSRGLRNPARNAILCGLLIAIGGALIWMGVADMRRFDRSGSPLLMLGLFPALLAPIGFVHFFTKIRVFRDMRSGRTAIARWTVPVDEFARFREQEARVPSGSILVNFYRLPRKVSSQGVEVVFSDTGVLIDGSYFPLSIHGGRRLQSVRYVDAPPTIEFKTALKTLARTSSATVNSTRSLQALRLPVASDAIGEAYAVVQRYQSIIDQSR